MTWICSRWEDETSNTRAVHKLFTPLCVLDTGWNKKCCLKAEWRRKTELMEKEKLGQMCPGTGDGRFRAGLWLTAGANCTHLIKQSMTASSRQATVVPENVPESDHSNVRYPSFNYIKDCWLRKPRFWPMSVYFAEEAVREQVERVWKWAFLTNVVSCAN